MSQVWLHPELGEFRPDYSSFLASVPNPWADEFQLNPKNSGQLFVSIGFADNASQPEPDSDSIEQLNRFWAARLTFPKQVCDFILADIRGHFRGSNWWSGADDTLRDAWGKEFPQPQSHEDLREQLGTPSVNVRYFPEESGQPLAVNPFTGEKIDNPPAPANAREAFWAVEVCFDVVWEEEHGLGALWRNGSFFQIGYGDGQLWPPKDYVPSES